jgi:predicted HTH domain antitoxin
MNVSFEIPQDIEQQLRSEGVDPNREAREAYLVKLYRQDRISHAQLRQALDVSFDEAERLIKEYGAGHDIDIEEFEAGRDLLRKARPQ